ncbi:MAG TPA: NAD(P)-dependent oxidoreductase [Acidimicrobiia bacterium]|nr:NAD(P)-dependent oxidoreductase [Acidimicrobiia bacterium]
MNRGRVGFVGLGRMGLPMCLRLARAGWEITGVDVSPGARARATAAGLSVDSQLGVLAGADVVLSSLPDGPEVSAVYRGPAGLFSLLSPGSLCIDLSTISVEVSRDLAVGAAAGGFDFVDAPVSGTSIHAEAGTLAIMVGGDRQAFARAWEYLAALGGSIHHVGPNGAGLEMKLIGNRLLTSHLVALAEAIIEIESAGLEMATCLEVLRAGAVPRLLDYKAGPMAERDFTPRFTIDLMAKDLRLAAERRPPGRLGAVATAILGEAWSAGHGAEDVGAVIEMVSSEHGKAQRQEGS